jgi:hypothetical protein
MDPLRNTAPNMIGCSAMMTAIWMPVGWVSLSALFDGFFATLIGFLYLRLFKAPRSTYPRGGGRPELQPLHRWTFYRRLAPPVFLLANDLQQCSPPDLSARTWAAGRGGHAETGGPGRRATPRRRARLAPGAGKRRSPMCTALPSRRHQHAPARGFRAPAIWWRWATWTRATGHLARRRLQVRLHALGRPHLEHHGHRSPGLVRVSP